MKTTLFAVAAAALLVSTAQAQDLKGSVDAGKAKNAMCIGCHGIPGYKASFPIVYSAPMIAGQNAKYVEGALAAYKAGERKHPTMRAIAGSLTAQDMADLGAYYASLK
jgi:cytochrome c553